MDILIFIYILFVDINIYLVILYAWWCWRNMEHNTYLLIHICLWLARKIYEWKKCFIPNKDYNWWLLNYSCTRLFKFVHHFFAGSINNEIWDIHWALLVLRNFINKSPKNKPHFHRLNYHNNLMIFILKYSIKNFGTLTGQ